MHCVGSSLLVEVSKVVEDLRVKRATIRLHAFMYELVSYFFVKSNFIVFICNNGAIKKSAQNTLCRLFLFEKP